MLSSELVNLKVYDRVMLKNGDTVCISKVIVPGEKYLYWDESGMRLTDEVPPQRTVTAEKIDHVVRQASAPSVCSSDGCQWIVGDIAEEGVAIPYGSGRGYRVRGRLFREAASTDPGLFGGAPWRELFLKAFHSEHPTYDPWEIARSYVREWERSNTAYEKRERDFIHDVPGVTECLRAIDTADRRAMLEMRRAFNTQKGDVITDERGRRLLVVTAPSDISPTSALISVIEINERMEAVKPMAPDLVHVIDVVSVIQRGAMSRAEVARFTTETIVAYVLRKTELRRQAEEEAERAARIEADAGETGSDVIVASSVLREPDEKEPVVEPTWIWCLVANVVSDSPIVRGRPKGAGTKMFPVGARLYVYPGLYGNGKRMLVLGRPRNRRGLRRVFISRSHVTNYRLLRVHNPVVVHAMCSGEWPPGSGRCGARGWDNSEDSRKRIEGYLAWLALSPEARDRYDTLLMCSKLRISCWREGVARPMMEVVMEPQLNEKDWTYRWVAAVSLEGIWKSMRVDLAQDFSARRLCELGLHLWDGQFGDTAQGESTFGWRLEVHGSKMCLLYGGHGGMPDPLLRLLSLLESCGLPHIFNKAAGRLLELGGTGCDAEFADAMWMMEGDEDMAVLLVRAMAAMGEPSRATLLKLLRMEECDNACTLFTAEERALVARAWLSRAH